MAYVPPKYPGAIPTAGDLPDRVDDVDWLYAARYNELKKELRACLIELGVDPAGAHATVVARLDTLGPGDVVGPGAALDEAIARYHGTSGKLIQATLGAKIDDTGRLTNTAQPCFLVQPTAEQTNFAINEYVTIVWGTEIFDVGNNFAANVFTSPVTGKVQFNIVVNLKNVDVDADVYLLRLVTSNRSLPFAEFDPGVLAGDPVWWYLAGSFVVDMDVNDTAYVQVLQLSGAVQTDIAAGESSFSAAILS